MNPLELNYSIIRMTQTRTLVSKLITAIKHWWQPSDPIGVQVAKPSGDVLHKLGCASIVPRTNQSCEAHVDG